MNENLDLTIILKDCPYGTKFYSKFLGVVTFERIQSDSIVAKDYKKQSYRYKKNGKYAYAEESAEMDLFPSKDQRDWSKWHRPFKDGDVVATSEEGIYTQLFLVKAQDESNDNSCYCYFGYDFKRNELFDEGTWACARLATEEEKIKLFQAIEKHDYRWNIETKTLEKIIIPKFKIGDEIKHKDDTTIITIIGIKDNKYLIQFFNNRTNKYKNNAIRFIYQDEYEFATFNINTLQPFDKVLVRDKVGRTVWTCAQYSHYDKLNKKAHTAGSYFVWDCCVPYNDDTKHLVGFASEAPEYYRYWEED